MIRPTVSKMQNGLQIITVELPHLHSAEIAIHIKVGGRNDPPDRTGISHFLEHMLFRGTDKYPSSFAIESAFESLGGSVNASTDVETTCYYCRIHPGFTAKGLEILASMILESRLEGIELEKSIIVEEALEDVNQNGEEINPDLITGRMLWPDHPVGESVIGSLPDISAISEADLRQHMDRWYRPGNSVIVAAGPISHEQILDTAIRCFGNWQPAFIPAVNYVAPVLPAGPACKFVNDSDSQITIQLAFRGYKRNSPELASLKILRQLVAGGGCSRLHMALREKLGLIYSVDASICSYEDTGCFAIDLSTAPENLARVIAVTIEELKELAISDLPKEELERTRTLYLAELDYSMDSVSEMGIRFGWGALVGVSRSIEEEQTAVGSVTADMIRTLASELFRVENRFMAVVGPLELIDMDEISKLLVG